MAVNTNAQSRVTTQFDINTNVTPAAVAGLSIAGLQAGQAYVVEGTIFTTSNVAGGVKVQLNTPDTLTLTSGQVEFWFANAGTIQQNRVTALASPVGITAVTVCSIEFTGTIVVNAAGTLRIEFAQNASNGANSSVLVGSFMRVRDIG